MAMLNAEGNKLHTSNPENDGTDGCGRLGTRVRKGHEEKGWLVGPNCQKNAVGTMVLKTCHNWADIGSMLLASADTGPVQVHLNMVGY